jgi:hypothetical protein
MVLDRVGGRGYNRRTFQSEVKAWVPRRRGVADDSDSGNRECLIEFSYTEEHCASRWVDVAAIDPQQGAVSTVGPLAT